MINPNKEQYPRSEGVNEFEDFSVVEKACEELKKVGEDIEEVDEVCRELDEDALKDGFNGVDEFELADMINEEIEKGGVE